MIFLTHGIQVTFGMEKTFPDSSKPRSDQALLALYRAGDGDAAAVLLSRYIPLINRYAYQFRSVLDPDDLIQEGSIVCCPIQLICIGLHPQPNAEGCGKKLQQKGRHLKQQHLLG